MPELVDSSEKKLLDLKNWIKSELRQLESKKLSKVNDPYKIEFLKKILNRL